MQWTEQYSQMRVVLKGELARAVMCIMSADTLYCNKDMITTEMLLMLP